MSMTTSLTETGEKLLTAEEFAELPELAYPCELDEGRLSLMNMPSFQHGKVSATIARVVGNHVEQRNLGHVLSNDSGIITKRDPDSVRGADVAFYSFDAVASDERPKPYTKHPPELVFEVLSPTERPGRIAIKVKEYLNVGVGVVCVVNCETETAEIHRNDQPLVTLSADDTLAFPDVLGDFSVKLSELFN